MKKLLSLFAFVAIATSAMAQTTHEGHEYVDLGLPSGILWATCNVGATTPEQYGDYFAWGETQSKETYNWSNEGDYKYGVRNTNDKPDGGMTKYNSTDNLQTLEYSDDAASVNWGSNWRTPTKADFDELIEACETQWTDNYNDTGAAGLVVTSKTDETKFIFLPAAGYYYRYGFDNNGISCKYWCSSIYGTEYPVAWSLNVANDYLIMGGNPRYQGYSIRPVLSKKSTAIETVEYSNSANVRKVMENGQVIFIRDGVRYNVLGARL